MVQLRLEPQTL